MAEPETDKHLVEEVLRGRTEAFHLLVWRWQRPLYNFLLRLTGDPERARDISQEAFLRAYTRLKDLRDKEKFASWLFRIAVNFYRSEQRSQQARAAVGFSEAVTLDAAEGAVHGGGREAQLAVRALISRLPPELREVLLLKVYHGFRFHEIATILDCPVSTVKSRLYKAFEQLRADLRGRKPPFDS